jgi:hypothetical protein
MSPHRPNEYTWLVEALDPVDEDADTPIDVHEICESSSKLAAKAFSNMKESFNTSVEVCRFFVTK